MFCVKIFTQKGIFSENMILSKLRPPLPPILWIKLNIQTTKTIKSDNHNVIDSVIRGKSDVKPILLSVNAHNLLWSGLLVQKLQIDATFDL